MRASWRSTTNILLPTAGEKLISLLKWSQDENQIFAKYLNCFKSIYLFFHQRLECGILEVERRVGCIPWHLPKVISYLFLLLLLFSVVCQIIQENHNRVLIQRLVTHGQLAISLLHWKRSFWMYIFLTGLKFNFLVHLPGPRPLILSLPPMSPRLRADHLHLHNLLGSF